MEESKASSHRKQAPLSIRARLYRYRCLLKRYWWVIFLGVSMAMCAQAYRISKEPPSYVSQAKMWVSGKVNLPEGGLYREELQNFFGTQIELMRSEKMQNRAHGRSKIVNPKLEPSPVSLKVIQAPRAAVFILQAVGSDALYTKTFLQSLMEEYLAYKQELRVAATDETVASVRKQLYAPEQELKEAQEKELTFRAANNVVFFQEQGSSAGGYLAKLNTRLADLKTQSQLLELLSADQRGDAGKLLNPGGDPKSSADLNQSAAFQKVNEQLAVLKAERQERSQYWKPKHPKMQVMDDEIARQERLLSFLRQQSREQLLGSGQSLRLEIQNTEQSIKEWEAKAQESSRKIGEHERLKANVVRVQSLYDRLLNTLQSVNTSRNLDSENVSVMENASTPGPMNFGRVGKMATAALLGLLASVGILYFIDRHDDRINSITEMMRYFDFPMLGHVPAVDVKKGQRLELVHPHDPRHSFVESFRDIRSALLFTADKGIRPKTILITSAIPNEGKSSVSSNLAVTLALSGSRVLLVDGDMRCGTLHGIFGTPCEPGLHEILIDQAHFGDVIRATSTPNLHLISAGKLTQTAGELFLGATTERFIKDVYPLYDFVVIDSPPVLATADTASVAPKMDGVLFVVRGGFTSARLSTNSLELLQQRQVNILGMILNRADPSFPEYYQYKYSKYYHRAAVPA